MEKKEQKNVKKERKRKGKEGESEENSFFVSDAEDFWSQREERIVQLLRWANSSLFEGKRRREGGEDVKLVLSVILPLARLVLDSFVSTFAAETQNAQILFAQWNFHWKNAWTSCSGDVDGVSQLGFRVDFFSREIYFHRLIFWKAEWGDNLLFQFLEILSVESGRKERELDIFFSIFRGDGDLVVLLVLLDLLEEDAPFRQRILFLEHLFFIFLHIRIKV